MEYMPYAQPDLTQRIDFFECIYLGLIVIGHDHFWLDCRTHVLDPVDKKGDYIACPAWHKHPHNRDT